MDTGRDENTQLLKRYMQTVLGEAGLRDLMNRWNDQNKHEKGADEMITALSRIMAVITGGERREADRKWDIESLESDPEKVTGKEMDSYGNHGQKQGQTQQRQGVHDIIARMRREIICREKRIEMRDRDEDGRKPP